jgi:EF hand
MRSRRRILSVVLLGAGLGLSLAAGAGAAEDTYRDRFQQLDKNADGYVTKDEWPLEPRSFDTVDRDKDGRLSAAELLTPNVIREGRRERQFSWLDVNRDGILSPLEWQRGGSDLQSLDRDKDGSITRRELRSTIEDTWRPGTLPPVQSRFRSADRNRDNRISRLEWPGVRPLFDRLDRNRDGVLSPYEWSGR